MIKAIFALIFLGILAAVINWLPIPQPFNWLIWVLLVIAALYVVAVMFGLVTRPSWWNGPPL